MLTSKQSLATRINRKYSLAQIIAIITFCGINNTCASIFHSGLPHVVLIWKLQYIKLNVWIFHWWMIISHKKKQLNKWIEDISARPFHRSIFAKVPGNKWTRELLCGEINLAWHGWKLISTLNNMCWTLVLEQQTQNRGKWRESRANFSSEFRPVLYPSAKFSVFIYEFFDENSFSSPLQGRDPWWVPDTSNLIGWGCEGWEWARRSFSI